MKLLRYGKAGHEKPALLAKDGTIRSLRYVISDLKGEFLSPLCFSYLAHLDLNTLPLVDTGQRIGPCVASVGKFICIGLNYLDHAEETGATIPKEPVVFLKATSAICGPYDPIIIPRGSEKTDWEVELGVVIGTPAKYVSKEKALDYVAGYCIINDVSERAMQLEGTGQWTKGKSCDSFAPVGPYLVTKDEVGDPQNLGLWLYVDGKCYQESNTREMAYSVAHLVSYLSHFFTLYPGDIISTGTPSGVGLGQKPVPIYLKPGQTVKLGISNLGEQEQKTMMEDRHVAR